jgi:small subunit ribosomal protein S34
MASKSVLLALQSLLPSKLPPSLAVHSGNLYQVLSRKPEVAGRRVYQTRWSQKHIDDSYWLVTRARFKCEGKHGKAWGKLYWKGEFYFYIPLFLSRHYNPIQANLSVREKSGSVEH